tara:strand:+ start:322 stop:654 length:333 start_codon:yes stop_codon:yes gene_type:complete
MNVILKRTSGCLDGSVERATSLLKAMANKHRLLVLIKLADREYSVRELEHVTGLGQSALSQHLARLRRDRLVTTRKSAQTVFYRLADRKVRKVLETLDYLYDREFETPLS